MNTFSASGLRRALEAGRETQDPAEERRLLAAARGGDRRALEQVTRRVSGSLYRFGRGFCRNPDDAEDVMQEVLAALVTSLHRFRGDATLSSWAYVVARNACARRRRRTLRLEPLEGGNGQRAVEIRDPAAGPDRAAERRELREALERAIARLPDSLRDVLVLRDVEGMSAAQVGKRVGLGERAVKSRLHRARVLLREMLAPHVTPDAPPREESCPDVARMISRFLEGELDGSACARLEGHVAGCAGCSAACLSLRAALGACSEWRHAPVPAHVRGAVRAALREVVNSAPPQKRRGSKSSR